MRAEDKYLEIRKRIVQLFHMNRNIFGYRKIHMLLHNEGIIVLRKSGSPYHETGTTYCKTKAYKKI